MVFGQGEMTSSVFVKEQQEVELGIITATGTGTTTLLTVSHVHTYREEVLSSPTPWFIFFLLCISLPLWLL